MVSSITDRVYGQSPGVAIKAPCVAVATTPMPLVGLTPVGGYSPNVGDRILMINQPDPTTNGIYNANAGAWCRAGDMSNVNQVVQGTLVVIFSPGAAGSGVVYQLTTINPIIGTTPLTFAPFVNFGIPYPQTPQEAAQGIVPINSNYPLGDIRRYGAMINGVTDDGPAWQTAVNAVCGINGAGAGGTITAAPGIGDSIINTPVVWPRNYGQVNVVGNGCTISAGAGLGYNFAWTMSTGQNQNGVNCYGLMFDFSQNSTAQGIIDLGFALNSHFTDCAFLGGTTGNFIIARVRNLVVGNDNTGSFWTRFTNCLFYYGTASGGFGIVLRGAANHTNVSGCSFINCDLSGVLLQQDAGQTTLPNGVTLLMNAFQGFNDYAIQVSVSTATAGVAGFKSAYNRFENGGTAYAFLGALSSQSSSPAVIGPDFPISDVATYLLNSSNDIINNLTSSTTPAINPSVYSVGDFTWTSQTGNMAARFGATGKGFSVQNTAGVEQGGLKYKAGGGAALVGSASGPLTLSATATPANNLRGSGATAGATTATVNFAVNEPDATYFLSVTLTSGTGVISSITKNAGSFEITWTGSVTNTFDWILIR